MTYSAPLKDMLFAMEHLAQIDQVAQLPGFEEAGLETAQAVLEECAKLCEGVVAPLNLPGDVAPSSLKDGVVTTTAGFKQAFRQYAEGGWQGLQHPQDFGGQGLPKTIGAACVEMLNSANLSFALCPLLTDGAIEALLTAGSDELKATYLEKLVTGEWTGTMNLTEPQAGSDLGLLRTQARPRGDGSYSLDGSKIFISGGDQDMSENIVHLVLARLPDAPAGTRGLSLFLAPRGIPQDGGGFLPNAIHCDGIEKKMGIKGSATCAMRFEGAQAWLVGQPHQGLAAMFVMMNSARLHVGLQGLGHAEMAWQLARAYAAERRQMRAQPRPADAQGPADPIALQPAVQRMLADLRVWTEGMRAIAGWVAHQLDLAEQAPDAEERAQAHALASLLTPVVKSFFTERGFALASEALQVFGGYGYVHEYRIEQTLRDARIAMIYEGTNQIQALDLLQRKVAASGGAALAPLLAALREEAAACEAAGMEPGLAGALRSWSDRTEALTGALCARAAGDAPLLARCAEDYLRLVGTLCMAFAWARAARVSQPLADPALRRSKADSAAWFFAHGLLDAEHWLRRTESAARTPLPAAVA